MLALDTFTLAVPDAAAAARFYEAVSLPFAVEEAPAHPGLCVVSLIYAQPSEVSTVVDAAGAAGATTLKPAKKSLFAGFSGVFQAPDGAIFKPASEHRKDKGPVSDPPVPTETAVLLGVADPQASKAFYTALGMSTDRDYGDKNIDFAPAAGQPRLGLMKRDALAKDAGLSGGDGHAVGLHARVGSVDALLAAVEAAGGSVVDGGFADPDGFVWRVTER